MGKGGRSSTRRPPLIMVAILLEKGGDLHREDPTREQLELAAN
jgi:hypothetical protein